MKRRSVFIIALACLILDQYAKLVFLEGDSITLIQGVLSFHSVYNDGAAFGILNGQGPLLSVIGSLVLISMVVYILLKRRPTTISLGLSLMLGGTTGNLLDRILNSDVVDFIKLDFISFPIFNIADIFIVCGAGLIILSLLLPEKKADK